MLQTLAANLGSMLTPVGNPQNLYLYGRAGLSLGAFLLLMLPYTLVSLILIVIWSLAQSRGCRDRTMKVKGTKVISATSLVTSILEKKQRSTRIRGRE